MVTARQVKPTFVLIERLHEAALGGLHELRGLNPVVFASKEAWAYLRRHYRTLSGQKGSFDDIYNFKRYVLEAEKGFRMGPFEAVGYTVSKALGFKVKLGQKTIWHASDALAIPEHVLEGVDIFIGDGSSLKKGVDPEHASMEEQIKWAQEADIPKIFFTQIGPEDHDKLNEELQGMAANSQALYDGAELSIGGGNPFAALSESLVAALLADEVKVIIRSKPYSEYAKQAILMGSKEKAYGLYVEGFPEKMSVEDAQKLEHGLSDAEWKALAGDQKDVWVYHPRILKRFEPAREIQARDAVGPYIHDAELIEEA